MNKTLLTFLLSSPFFTVSAQDGTTKSTSEVLDTLEITAFKVPVRQERIPFKVQTISQKTIRSSTSVNNAYLLRDEGNVFVQQSQLGGGSPVIRGFEASRILLVVDGVRMNNAIYRTGHLQNLITVDKNVVDDITIIHGANSTLYGTDALGGIIDIRTADPMKGLSDDKRIAAQLGTQYNSAYNSFNNYARLQYGNQKFAGLTIASFNKIGDLTQGSNYRNEETENWKRNQYIERVNNEDVIRDNSNPNKQLYSAYNQFDLLQKLVYKPNATTAHSLNFQYSTTNDIPRYDRLTDRRNGQLRWAEWYYGPQKRLLGIYKFEKEFSGIFDKLTANLNYQSIEESRFQRPFGNVKRQSRIEALNIYGYTIDLVKQINDNHKFQIGTDGQLNFLNSTAYYQNIETGERDYNLDSRYPDGDNRMNYYGIYGQYFHSNKKDNFHVHAGLRANYSTLYSQFINTSILNLPFNEAKQNNLTYSGNIGATYKLHRYHYVTGSVSTAFRVPNIDDLAKVFESAGGVQLVIPNPDLKPEQAINFDLEYRLVASNKIRLELNGFYTLFRNAIVLDKFTLNGQDSILYDGSMTPVVANQNKAKAFIYGFSTNVEYAPITNLTFSGAITYTYGRYHHEATLVPLDHIPPVYGMAGVAYRWKSYSFRSTLHFNGAKRLKDYNPYGEDNLQYATPGGVPGWYTWNIYASKSFAEYVDVVAGVENITDNNYRVFASGISAPGRNFVLKLNLKF